MYDIRKGKLQISLDTSSAATSEHATISVLHNGFVYRKNITIHETSYGNELADPRASAQHILRGNVGRSDSVDNVLL